MMSLSTVKDSGRKLSPRSDVREGDIGEGHIMTQDRSEKNKRRLRIGSWNVRTLQQAGKLENLKNEMRRNDIDIMGVSEVRWEQSGELLSDEFRMFYSGNECGGDYGVGIVLGRRVKDKVIGVRYINDRVIVVRLKGKCKDLVLVQVYMPHSGLAVEQVEDMYETIEEVMEKERKESCIIVMGDWNAVVGEGQEGITVGKYGLGDRNERGGLLVDFCKRNSLIVGNTLFQQHKRRRYTWTCPLNRKRYQIDFILVQERYRNCLKNAKTLPGADINSDHVLLIGEVDIRLKKIKRTQMQRKLDIEKLRNEEERNKFVEKFHEKIGTVDDRTGNSNKLWESLKSCLKETAEETIGFRERKNIKKPWITEKMLEKMEERRKWKNINTAEGRNMYKKLNNQLRRETDKAKLEWMKQKCEEIEDLERKGKYDLMYREVKCLDFVKKNWKTMWAIEDENSREITDRQGILDRWKEYIEELYATAERPCSLEIEEEKDVSEDDKGFSILMEEVEIALKQMKNGKAAGSDGIPIELIKCLGEGKKEILHLCNEIYKKGEWPEDFIQTVMIPIPKKSNAKKCNEYRTISLISHAAKILLRILNRRLQAKVEAELEEEQFGFRKGKGTRDAIGLLRTIGERYIEKDKEVCVVFIDLEKAFDRVNWTKLMDILKKIGTDWRERRLLNNLYMKQCVTVRIGGEMTEGSEIGRGVRQGCSLSPTLFNIYLEAVLKDCFQETGGVTIGGRRIKCVRFADDMALLAENENTVNKMLTELENSCKQYGMKINPSKTKAMVIGRKPRNINVRIGNDAVEQVNSFRYLGCLIRSDMSCCQEVKVRIGMAKEAFRKRRNVFCGPMEKELRKRLVKCFVWSVALYGSETWTLRRSEEKRLEAFEMWVWRRMERVKWTDRIRNSAVLERVGEERILLKQIKKRKRNWLGHWLRRDCLMKEALEGLVNGKRTRGKRRLQLIDSIKIKGSYVETKRKAENRKEWRMLGLQ